MQYVGKFVSTVYNTITPNINPATLSGAIDVIVVERTIDKEDQVEVDARGNELSESEQGKLPEHERKYKTVTRQTTELASTPFHVRFGKMSVLRPGERKVTLHLNSSTDPLPFAMKVSDSGEAFFVLEIDDEDERNNIPADLVTSPILSAASSPFTSPEDGDADFAQQGSADVEPLELGEAEELPPITHESDLMSAGFNDNGEENSKEKLKENKQSGEPNEEGDLNVPSDSTKTGSGSAAGSDSLLDKVGSAASKASGVLGAAGRAVIGGGANPRLDKTAEKAQRSDYTDNMTGAPVDEDREDAHEYEPEQGGPQGKKRQEAQDESATHDEPANETERLEKQLHQKAMKVVEDEAQSDHDSGSIRSLDSGEEAYPAPFGTSRKASSKSKTKSVASIHHSEYLGGKRLKPVPIGDGNRTIDPAMTDASTHIYRHEKRQQSKHSSDRVRRQAETTDDDDEDTAVDDDDDEDKVRSGEADADDDEPVGTVKVKQRKEDLQYMLDMDGYKMTQDGEDLAYQEGHRFADEMPLGRRHGGKGRNGHPDRINGPGHQHKVSLPGGSTTAMRRGSGSRSHRPSFSVDYRTNRSSNSQSREREARRESMDDTAAANLSKFNSQFGASHLGAISSQSGHQDELELSRDLAKLARMNRASEFGGEARARGRRQPKGPETLRRHASLTNRSKQTDAKARTATKRTGNGSTSGHTHEFSLSDTEAEVPNAKSTSGHNSIENSTEGLASNYTVSDVVTSLRDLRLPSEESPPIYMDGSAAHLGLSNNSRWQWADPAGDSSASTPTGEPSTRRRTRFASSDGLASRSSDAAALESLRRHTAGGEVSGKLTSSESEPYTFLLQLEEASHSFELSLCYSDAFGQDDEVDEYAFVENRVSFERFAHDEDVVNDERLVIRYHDRFLTWENASAVLATLSLYRRTLSGAASAANIDEEADEAEPSSRSSYWSRWFKRSSRSISDLKQVADGQSASTDDLATTATQKPKRGPHTPASIDTSIARSNTDSVLLETDKTLADQPATTPSKAAAAVAARTGKTYAKTLRLTSDQLKSLNLRKGANSITFSVTSSYSGVATCTARIFLWESNHKIVVSDIDGTITKSDALGHVFTMIGRDWTHIGVAKLYTDIARNGYRIMYLTSRAIGQADSTRDYLKGIRQNGYQLPDGPVIMSPDRLIASLHREVILRKPEVFKMACLRDIARLFGADPRTAHSQPGGDIKNLDPEAIDKAETGAGVDDSPAAGAATAAPSSDTAPLSPSPSNLSSPTLASIPPLDPEPRNEHPTPFYAGFGNRITDALSYRSVNIPSSRIYTIDTNGEVKMELLELAGYKSSYIHMTDLVDQMFPPITAKEEKEPRKPEFNDFNFWRPAVVEVELPGDDELLGTPPVSPALSARSGRSARSVRSVTSDSGTAEKGEEKVGRLSRFGLGSLGLSRKGSQNRGDTNPAPEEERRMRATSAEPALESISTSPSSSSWTAPWRRRAASPDPDFGTRATSPLMGPVLTAEPESEDEGNDDDDEFYDSGDGDDDDVGTFDLDAPRPSVGGRKISKGRPSEDEADEEDEDDELLETGEIRFEWKG